MIASSPDFSFIRLAFERSCSSVRPGVSSMRIGAEARSLHATISRW